MTLWTALHDNRWTTTVVENPDGTFSAWAAPDGETRRVDAVEHGAETAKRAADLALARETGHTECSPDCRSWSRRTYTVFDRRAAQRPMRRIA